MMRSVLIAAALAGALLLGVATRSQADIFIYTGSVVDYTVPTTGTYDIQRFRSTGRRRRRRRRLGCGHQRRYFAHRRDDAGNSRGRSRLDRSLLP